MEFLNSCETGSNFEVTNPANAEVIARVSSCGVAETEAAIEAASVAFKSWRKMTPKARGALVAKWGELITANAAQIGAVITFENGKPIGEGKGEANYSGRAFILAAKLRRDFELHSANGQRLRGVACMAKQCQESGLFCLECLIYSST